uniref:Craniofacial development protein 2 n=1 Tax=Cacopsylla melanoneura TaxID=428564 RepID=A0A8D8S118_9HEMI
MAMLAAKSASGVSPSIGSPGGTGTSKAIKRVKWQKKINIMTWNVKTLNQEGKIHNAIKEMKRMRVDILGISEMRWLDSGDINVDEHRVLYSGRTDGKHEQGVGIILSKEMGKCITSFTPISPRVLLVQLKGSPIDINIIQVYAPTTDRSDEEVQEFYNSIELVLKKLKKDELNIVMGDYNAKLGEGRTSELVGPFGLGERNTRGDDLETFAMTNNLVVTNTWFKQPPRKLYTWKSPLDRPGRIVRNQIDYILVNKRFRNSCTTVKTYPGADINSDHVPLMGAFKIKMKRTNLKRKQRYDLRRLKDPNIKQEVKLELNRKININTEQNCNNPDIEKEMDELRKHVLEVKEKHLKPDKTKRKSWMTNEILDLMEERRIHKGRVNEYKRIQSQIRTKIREAKESELKEKCQEIEFYQDRYDSFNVHKKVREVTGKYKKSNCGKLIDEGGNLMIGTEERKNTWKKYVEKLFQDERSEKTPNRDGIQGDDILEEEVQVAIKQIKHGKAAGLDEVEAEFLKLLDEIKIKWLTQRFNKIYSTGNIPSNWLKSEFITLPKKPSAKQCGDYRTISLMSHLLKVFLKIIHRRIYKLCEEQIAPNQFGFVNAVGTREALFSVQVLFQRCRDVNKDVFLCLIDYQKAFDRVKHDKMVEVLKKIGISERDIQIIVNLYWNQTAVLRVDGEHTEAVKILRGVRQGCILSPILFNIYSEYIFRESLDEMEEGIPINGVKLNNIRYADDTIVFADSIQALQALMDSIVDRCEPPIRTGHKHHENEAHGHKQNKHHWYPSDNQSNNNRKSEPIYIPRNHH